MLKSELHHRRIKERVDKLEEQRHHLFLERNELRQIVEDSTGTNNAEVCAWRVHSDLSSRQFCCCFTAFVVGGGIFWSGVCHG